MSETNKHLLRGRYRQGGQKPSVLTQHNDHNTRKTIFLPPSCVLVGTIRSENKQAPQTKIGSSQELAVRLQLKRRKQAERRENRDMEAVCTGPEQILLLP